MKKTAEGKQPFDVRVGVGFQQFRGMRTVTDAVNTPPNFWRYLQNVRLGQDGITSRPGLAPYDNPAATVLGFAEIPDEVQSATLFFGPYPRFVDEAYISGAASQIMGYCRVDLSRVPPSFDELDPDASDANALGLGSAAFIMAVEFLGADLEEFYQAGPLSPCGSSPYFLPPDAEIEMQDGWAPLALAGTDFFCFYQTPVCMDPLVLFNGRWLAAGHYRGSLWTPVGDFEPSFYQLPGPTNEPAVGSAGAGGQQIVEVNFTTQSPIDRLASLGYATDPGFVPGDIVRAFAGGVTEVFRLPSPGYKRGAQQVEYLVPGSAVDPAHFPSPKWVRSMVVVKERDDDPFTADIDTRDRLYIGTAGGDVKSVAVGAAYGGGNRGFNDPTKGEVYSWDGTTLRLELTNAGQACVVSSTPTGGVLAAGATTAAYKVEKNAAWQPVTYSPVPTVPPSAPNLFEPEITGYFWHSRCVFQGDIFLIGIDRGASFGSGITFGYDSGRSARLVIGRFNAATLTITIVRTGAFFSQAADNNLNAPEDLGFDGIGGNPFVQLSLATNGSLLYYLTHWNTTGFRHYVGTYDGVTFDDDAILLPDTPSANGPRDLVAAGGAVYACDGPFLVFRIDGTTATLITRFGSILRSGEMAFVGP